MIAEDLVSHQYVQRWEKTTRQLRSTGSQLSGRQLQYGVIVWQSNLPSADSRAPAPHNRLLNGQWSSPTIAVVGGKVAGVFYGGDGVSYGLNARTGNSSGGFDLNPPVSEYLAGGRGERCEIVATPVFVDDSINHRTEEIRKQRRRRLCLSNRCHSDR